MDWIESNLRAGTVQEDTVLIPLDPTRREKYRLNFLGFCLAYFPAKIFRNPNRFNIEFAAELQRLALSPIKDKKAIAAPRGIGKSTMNQLFCIWCICYRHREVTLWTCVNLEKTEERIQFIKAQFWKNDLLMEDFPELCAPVRLFENDAKMSHPYKWTDNLLSFANGCWVVGVGLDGPILGMLKDCKRPDMVLIDDPEDTRTVKSAKEKESRRDRIEKELGYLGELGERFSICMITTIRAIDSLSAEYCDEKERPDWRGKIYRAVECWPDRPDLWQIYMDLVGPSGMTLAKLEANSEQEIPKLQPVELSDPIDFKPYLIGIRLLHLMQEIARNKGFNGYCTVTELRSQMDNTTAMTACYQNSRPLWTITKSNDKELIAPTRDGHMLYGTSVKLRTGQISISHAKDAIILWMKDVKRQDDKNALIGKHDEEAAKCLGFNQEHFNAFSGKRKEGLRFYASKFDAMNAGAVLLDGDRLPLHEIYDLMAQKGGKDSVFSELQNDPLGNEDIISLQLAQTEIIVRQSTCPPTRVPQTWARHVLVSIDMGLYELYWTAKAWDSSFSTRQVIQYGAEETHVNEGRRYSQTSVPGIRAELRRQGLTNALLRLESKFSRGFATEDGQDIVQPMYIGVDIGGTADKEAWNDIVYEFCRPRYPRWIPMKGVSPWGDREAELAGGKNFSFKEWTDAPGVLRMNWNTDFFKTQAHFAWRVPIETISDDPRKAWTPSAGASFFYREDKAGFSLDSYAYSMTAERFHEEQLEGKTAAKSVVRKWIKVKKFNHLFDCDAANEALSGLAFEALKQVQVPVEEPTEQQMDYRQHGRVWDRPQHRRVVRY